MAVTISEIFIIGLYCLNADGTPRQDPSSGSLVWLPRQEHVVGSGVVGSVGAVQFLECQARVILPVLEGFPDNPLLLTG